MPAKDSIHDQVKQALINDGWRIISEQFSMTYRGTTVWADLAAEKLLAVEKEDQKILVEVKSFTGPSPIRDLEVALGQYQIYLPFLRKLNLEYTLYIAISLTAYETIFQRSAIQMLIDWHKIPLIVVDIQTEEIKAWINS